MGILDFTIKRALPAAAATSMTAWAGITTANDDWDDYFPSSSSSSASANHGQEEKIVILGSGWAALNALRKCASPHKSVVIVSPRPHFLYTPLLASSSVGTITLRSACEPLRALVETAASKATSATFVRADAREIDVHNKKVYATTDSDGMGLELTYDKLVIAVGAQPNTFGIPGVQEHGLFLKEAEDSAKLHAKLLSNLEKAAALSHQVNRNKYAAEIDRLLKVVVVGGGPTGVELCAELADFKNHDVAKRYGTDISEKDMSGKQEYIIMNMTINQLMQDIDTDSNRMTMMNSANFNCSIDMMYELQNIKLACQLLPTASSSLPTF